MGGGILQPLQDEQPPIIGQCAKQFHLNHIVILPINEMSVNVIAPAEIALFCGHPDTRR
jgi:hypothetical protein